MSSDEATKRATEYINAALQTQGRLGYASRVADEVYQRAVSHAARAFKNLSVASEEGRRNGRGEKSAR